MKISRRDFINIGGKSLLGGIILASTPFLLRLAGGTTKPASAANFDKLTAEKHYWGFVCDTERCIGCGKCVIACKLENKVPWVPEYNRTWV